MEAAGIIERNVAIVDTRALGMTITAIVEVHLTDERPPTVDGAKALFLAAPEVQQCYYVTGGISFVLVIVAGDMIEYEAISRRLFADNDADRTSVLHGNSVAVSVDLGGRCIS